MRGRSERLANRHSRWLRIRLPRKQRRQIGQAAAVQRQTVKEFIIVKLGQAACRVIKAHDEHPANGFEVLCRFDAFADYVAHIEADNAKDAAWLARESHGEFHWRRRSVCEFDARLYVTLDAEGDEIESTKISDL